MRNVGHDFPSFSYKVITTLMIGPPCLRFNIAITINLQEFPAKKLSNYIYNMYFDDKFQCPCKQLIVITLALLHLSTNCLYKFGDTGNSG